jgi:transposase
MSSKSLRRYFWRFLSVHILRVPRNFKKIYEMNACLFKDELR